MYRSLHVKNFRCFSELSVRSLARINLIAGSNSAGKTSLLESVFLLMGGGNLGLTASLSGLRGVGPAIRADLAGVREILWQPLFRHFSMGATIEISGEHALLGTPSLSIRVAMEDATQLALEELSPELSRTTEGLRRYSLAGSYRDALSQKTATLSLTPKGGLQEPPPGDPPFPGLFLASGHRESPQEDAERFGQLELSKQPVDLSRVLHFIEPRLKRLSTIVVGGVPALHGDIGLDRMLPLALMGDGVRRVTSILLAILASPGGVVLVDEVENGLHHTVLTKAWRALADAAKQADVQLFATTHSFECIRAAHTAFQGLENTFRLHRLERVRDDIVAKTYDKESLDAAMKADLEVR